MKLFLLTLALVGIAIAGMAIKMFVKKDGEFKKSCSSADPNSTHSCTCQSSKKTQCNNK